MGRRRGWSTKLARYGLTGGAAAVVDLGGFALLLGSGVPLPLAATLSFLIATVVNYLLSAGFAFGAPISAQGYLRFLSVACLGLVMNVGITVVVGATGTAPALAKAAGILVAFGVNFLLNLTLVFASTERSDRG